MIKNIVLFVNYNFYDSKRYFAEKFSEALKRKGIKVHILDSHERPIEASDVAQILQHQPDFTCSFNSFSALPDGKFIWDILKIPHVSFLLDSVAYSLQYTHSPYSILTCVDRSDCAALRAYNFNKTFFWPHAIEKDIDLGKESRSYDVVFLGSCYDYESLRDHWQNELPQKVCSVLDDSIDLILSDRIISISEALTTSWEASRLSLQNVDFASLFFYLDYYTRGKDRIELIRSIKDANVHVFGDMMNDHPSYRFGWSHYLGSQSNVTIHPGVQYAEGLNVLRQSKVCLNSIPCFRNGSHERVFAGLGCGSVPITSDSSYWRDSFDIGSELLIYRSGQWHEVNDLINKLLASDEYRKNIILKGKKKVLTYHTWDIRVDQLLEEIPTFLTYLAK